MNHKKKICFRMVAAILAAAFVIGCASTPDLAQKWVSRPADELIRAWGQPDAVVSLDDGRKVLTWITYEEPADPLPCRRSFTVSPDGVVEKFSASSCTSGRPSPFRNPRQSWR